MYRRLLLVWATLIAGGLSVAPVSVAQDDTVVAPVRCAPGVELCSSLAGGAFFEAWTTWDVARSRYVAMQWERMTSRKPSRIPIAGRARPFDLDIGNVSGFERLVYSRCVGDPGGPDRGCAAYTWDTRRERPLAAPRSERSLHPAIGRGGLAIAEKRSRYPVRLRLCSTSGTRCRALPRGPLGDRPMQAAPTRMDMQGRRLVIAWSWWRGGIRHSTILLVRNVLKRGRLRAATIASGSGASQVFAPSLDIGMLFYVRGDSTCGGAPTQLLRFSPSTGRTAEFTGPPLSAMAHVARMTLYVGCGDADEASVMIAQPEPFGYPTT